LLFFFNQSKIDETEFDAQNEIDDVNEEQDYIISSDDIIIAISDEKPYESDQKALEDIFNVKK
jgi:hypothetical protein